MDKKIQKGEGHHLSMLGSIEELERIASDTAGIITLYYREQIQLIDMSEKIPYTNVFNDNIRWIKDVLVNFRPEGIEERPVTIVAEYVTAWIIDALNGSKSEVISTEQLPQQLWLCLIKRNLIELENLTNTSDIVGAGTGRQIIPLIVKNKETGNEISVKVPLQCLIGCPSMITNDGKIYECPVSGNPIDREFKDLTVYGYVYTSLFLSDTKSFEEIINTRKLHISKQSPGKTILKRFDDIIPYAAILTNRDNNNNQSFILKDTMDQVSQVLRKRKTFYDTNSLEADVEQTRIKIDNDIDNIKERMQHKTDYFQISIEAFSEEMKLDYDENVAAIQRDNDDQCNQVTRNLMSVLEQIGTQLEENISRHLTKIEQRFQNEWTKSTTVIESINTHSNEAITTTSEVVLACRYSAEEATRASEEANKLLETAESQCTEFVKTTGKHETTIKETTSVKNKSFEKTISDERAKSQKIFEDEKQKAVTSGTNATHHLQAAQESFSSTQEIMTRTNDDCELKKRETEGSIAEAQLITRENDQSTERAEEVVKLSQPLADSCEEALDRFDTTYKRYKKALKILEKKAKKRASK